MLAAAKNTDWTWLFKRLALAVGTGALLLAIQFVGRTHQRREEAASLRIDQELGMTVQPVDAGLADDLDLPTDSSGLVVTSLAEGRPGDRAGLQPGDLVEQIGSVAITNQESAVGALNEQPGSRLNLIVNRHGRDVQLVVNRG